MAHKPECAKTKDPNAACSLNCESPTLQTCWDCGQDIGASETKCPKCQADLTVAKAEDDVVERSLKRIAAKRKKKAVPPPVPGEPVKKTHPFRGLSKIFDK
jgi:predicted amidophosphoribosyltransferase